MQIGDAIRRWRESCEMSQRALARELGITASHLSQIEGGGARMQDELIGSLKGMYPDLWSTLVRLRTAEQRRVLRLDDAEQEEAALHAELRVDEARRALEQIRKDIDRRLDDLTEAAG